jgi:hypothetical protein
VSLGRPTTSRPTLRRPRIGHQVGHDPKKATTAAGIEEAGGGHEAHQQADSEVARARIELATPRFSVKEPDAKDPPWLQGLS